MSSQKSMPFYFFSLERSLTRMPYYRSSGTVTKRLTITAKGLARFTRMIPDYPHNHNEQDWGTLETVDNSKIYHRPLGF